MKPSLILCVQLVLPSDETTHCAVTSRQKFTYFLFFLLFLLVSCFFVIQFSRTFLIVGCEEGTGSNFICYAYRPKSRKAVTACQLGNNRIAGLFTVLFISNACHNLLQQPKPSILSFIATFVQAENCSEYCAVLFIYFPKVISCNNRFNCQQNTWL